jgi:hypothetical protein
VLILLGSATTFSCFFIPFRYPTGMQQTAEYEHHTPHDHHREAFSGAHVSIGGVKCAAGAVACMLLAEKIKTPEQRYLILAGIGALVGAIDTAWRDHLKAQREACREERERGGQ